MPLTYLKLPAPIEIKLQTPIGERPHTVNFPQFFEDNIGPLLPKTKSRKELKRANRIIDAFHEARDGVVELEGDWLTQIREIMDQDIWHVTQVALQLERAGWTDVFDEGSAALSTEDPRQVKGASGPTAAQAMVAAAEEAAA